MKDNKDFFGDKIDFKKVLFLQVERTARVMSSTNPLNTPELTVFESHVKALNALLSPYADNEGDVKELEKERGDLRLGTHTDNPKIYGVAVKRFSRLMEIMDKRNLLLVRMTTEDVA